MTSINDPNLSYVAGPVSPWPELDKCLHELFREQVAKTPSNIAVIDGQRTITYEELDKISDKISGYLVDCGIVPDDCVGILMDKSLEYVVAYTGILKSGGAYMPLDVGTPKQMLEETLQDVKPKVVICKKKFIHLLPKDQKYLAMDDEKAMSEVEKCEFKENKVTPSNLAYYVLSSGTTGKPKSIICPHRGAVNSYVWRYKNFPYAEGEREGVNIFFVWECFRPLLQGYPTVVIPDEIIYNPPELVKLIREQKITRMLFTPSLLQAVLDFPKLDLANDLSTLKLIILCGEVVTRELERQFKQRVKHCKLLNLYSVSECHDIGGAYIDDLQSGDTFCSAGFIIDNTQAYILDEKLNLVPKGVVGRLFVGGVTLARGYLNNPQLTNERFIPNPFMEKAIIGDDNRLYETGDLARFLPDNSLEIRGRYNSMQKIRGYSIELRAVEVAISEHEHIKTAVVTTYGDDLLTKQLVAYIVPEDDVTISGQDIKDYLKKKVPHYMIPNIIIKLDKIPILETSGKTDYKKLPKPEDVPESVLSLTNFTKPANENEEILLDMWSNALNLSKDKIGTGDDFFDLGGNSLQIARLYGMIQNHKGWKDKITLSEMRSNPTIIEMAKLLSENTKTEEEDLEADSKLPDDIKVEGEYKKPENISKIFLTGATGYLGAYLLRDALEKYQSAMIYCLVRANDDKQALDRIRKNLEEKQIWKESYLERIIALSGNLEISQFGLSDSLYNDLSNEIDLIIHCGAAVHFTQTYKEMKGSNIIGTLNILKLCVKNKIKYLYYISTTGVFSTINGNRMYEEDSKLEPKGLVTAYEKSKFVAEKLVLQAKDRGVPLSIFRPGDITGDSKSGVCNMNHDFVIFLQGIIQLKLAPRDYRLVDTTPVDYVSRAIIDSNMNGGIFHLVHQLPIRMLDIIHFLKYENGYEIDIIGEDEFLKKLLLDENNPLISLYPILATNQNKCDVFFKSSVWKRDSLPDPYILVKKMIGYLISINAIPKPNSLYGKVAAITGASSGIGKAIAIELAKLGVSVSLTARRAEQLKLVCEEITKLGHNAMYVVGDVTNQTQMKDWIEQTKKQFGNIDILVNCAGIMPCTMMESCHFDEWNKCIDINMKGVLNGIGCVLQDFIKRGRGDIVTISSNAGRQVWEALTVYSATKFGVEAISGGLRKETYGKGIRVMSIQPGDVKTEIYDHDNTEPAAMQKIINQWAPKVLDPEDVARAVAYALKQPDHVAINEILIEPSGFTSK